MVKVQQRWDFRVKMTDYEFEIYRIPPKLGEHKEQIIEEWLPFRKGCQVSKHGA